MSEGALMERDEQMPARDGHSAPQSVLAMAIQQGAGVEQLEALMALQERHETNEARKAFHRAMSAFRSNPPRIGKDRAVQAGPASWTHASLANVVEKISIGMAPHGLSFRWETAQEDKSVTVTCVTQHVDGHEERTTLTAPPDDSGRKNSIQQIASTVTYLERYTLLAATGLATEDMVDDDAQSTADEPITSEQAQNLNDRLDACDADKAKFCEFLAVNSLAEIRDSQWPRALKAVEAKEKQARG
jgi:hypothetical protein